jgi:hypothetical protein
MEHWATVLDIIEAGLAGDREKVRAYAELLLERLGEVPPVVPHLRLILEGEAKGRPVLPAAHSEENG